MQNSFLYGFILILIALLNVPILATKGFEDVNLYDTPKQSTAFLRYEINAGHEPKIRHNRSVNIHVQVMTSKPWFGTGQDVVGKDELDDSVLEDIVGGNNISELCKECLRKKIEKMEFHLMPAHPCDRWDPESSTCWLDRSIGATVTLSLTFRNAEGKMQLPAVTWQQEFHVLHQKDRIFFAITPDNLLWNTAISSKGHEFRISPISDADVEPNRFSASVSDASTPINKVHFKIRLIPIDLGFVYPGETFVVNMESYISLPIESMAYQWYMEMDTETGILPSNMKGSPSGSVLTISELRKDQAGNLSCNVYTNLGFMVARKRFIIRNMTKENKLLKSPEHSNKSKVSSTIKNKVVDKRFKIKRRDVLSKAQKQLEAVLWALKYHNAQQSSMEDNSENDETYKPLPSETRYSSNNNERQKIVSRFYQPARMQKQELGGRMFGQNSPEFQKRLSSRQQMDSGGHYFKAGDRPFQPLNAVAGSRTDIDQGPRTRYQNERPRPIQQIIPEVQSQQITKYLISQDLQQPEIGLSIKNRMQTRLNKEHDYDEISYPDDRISILIAKCQRSAECSSHAKCVIQSSYKGFCRCLSRYRGNGITCWEFSSKLNTPTIE
ncbi:hypothetical protein JTE90_015094 [Oedothorax gibbosus]|uniref:EGF-like domain-containing protein n=1 Tax=Oedothorax gibbosus TaxID=931172 RepID=A0AAV6VQU9_9ARAC|nr:hypothetical protein JTE90_015094 [Oedothorax gibbosus]